MLLSNFLVFNKLLNVHKQTVMKRIAFLCLLCLITISSCDSAKDRLDTKPFVAKVKVNEMDCFRCFGGTHAIQELSEVAHIELVFRDIGETEIQRYLELNGFNVDNGNLAFEVASNPPLYDALDEYGKSELHLFDNEGNEMFASPFDSKSLDKKIDEVRTLGREMTKPLRPKLDLKYKSGFLDLSVSDNYCLVANRDMSYCEVFDKESNLLFCIDALDIDPLDLFPEMRDKEPYVRYLKEMGLFACRIENARLDGDEVLLKVFAPYVEVRNDTVVQGIKPCMILYSEESGVWSSRQLFDSSGLYIEAIGNAKGNEDCYGIVRELVGEDLTEYKSLRMKAMDGKLQAVETKVLEIPDFNRLPGFAYEPKVKDGIFALSHTDFLYDLKNDSVYVLPIKSNLQMTGLGTKDFTISSDGHVMDWSYNGDALAVIYYDAKSMQCEYLFKEIASGETSITLLPFGKNLKCPALYLASPHVLYYLDSENTVQVMSLFCLPKTPEKTLGCQ